MELELLTPGTIVKLAGERGFRYRLVEYRRPPRKRSRLDAVLVETTRSHGDGASRVVMVRGKRFISKSGLVIRPRRLLKAKVR
jgi:hypothetical protein